MTTTRSIDRPFAPRLVLALVVLALLAFVAHSSPALDPSASNGHPGGLPLSSAEVGRGALSLVLLLLFGHALADFPLQGDYLARAKNRTNPLPGTPWWIALGAHALIHAGAVLLVTGSPWLALAELVAHAVIDDAKCAGHIGYVTDQAMHVACKLAWTGAVIGGAK